MVLHAALSAGGDQRGLASSAQRAGILDKKGKAEKKDNGP